MSSSTNLCRGCIREVLGKHRYSLKKADIKELFQQCTSIELSPDDPPDLPQQLCSECLSKCYQWKSFQTMCLATNLKLHTKKTLPNTDRFEEEMSEPEAADEDFDYESESLDHHDDQSSNASWKETINQADRLPDNENIDEPGPSNSNPLQDQAMNIQCPLCHRKFHELGDLKNHFVIHTEEIPFICNRCAFATQTNEDIRVHIRMEHEKVPTAEDWSIREGSIFHNAHPWEAMGHSVHDPSSVTKEEVKGDSSKDSRVWVKKVRIYEIEHKRFMEWKFDNNYTEATNEDHVLAYMKYCVDVKRAASSTFWPRYSALRSELKVKEGLDLTKFHRVRAFCKEKGAEPVRKANTFTADEIAKFINTAPDSKWFLHKITTILSICCSLRVSELYALPVDYVTIRDNEVEVRIPSAAKDKYKLVTIVKTTDFDAVKMITDYNNIANQKKGRKFFISGMKNMVSTGQRLGQNGLKNHFREIAEYLELPNANGFTSESGRRTSKIYNSLRNEIRTTVVEVSK